MSDAQTLGKYELLARLGRGRNCEVFLAVRRGAQRQRIVALKRLRAREKTGATSAEEAANADADANANAALLREAELAAMIKHPKVVDVYEYGEEEGICYIAMEYLAGQPLGALIRKQAGPLPAACVARIGADIADGLEAAHRLRDDNGERMGIVHLDVSPSNVQVTYDGRVLLVDFGLARAVGVEPTTRGKIGYLAPEQVAREEPDPRTDVFALGIVLWEAATGKRLYRRDSRDETLAAIAEEDATKPSDVTSSVDPVLEKILVKALARSRDDRYQTASELAKALRAYLADSDVTDTAAEISRLMLEHFGSERETSDAAVASALEVLAGEKSGPILKRALSAPIEGEEAGKQSQDESLPNAAADADEEYYYYDEDVAEAAAAPVAVSEATKVPVAAKAETATDATADNKPALDSTDGDPIDGDELDEAAELDAIARRAKRRTWMIIAAAAVFLLGVGSIVALSGRDDGNQDERSQNTAGASDTASTNSGIAEGTKVTDRTAPTPTTDTQKQDTPPSEPANDDAVKAANEAAATLAKAAAEKEAAANAAAKADAEAAEKAAAEAAEKAAAELAADKAAADKAAADKDAAKAAALEKIKAAQAAKDKAAGEKKTPNKSKARAAYKAASRLLVTGQTNKAIRKYRKALDEWPGYSPAYRGLGLAYERIGRSKKAVRYYKRYLRAAPRAKDADSIRGRIARLGG